MYQCPTIRGLYSLVSVFYEICSIWGNRKIVTLVIQSTPKKEENDPSALKGKREMLSVIDDQLLRIKSIRIQESSVFSSLKNK